MDTGKHLASKKTKHNRKLTFPSAGLAVYLKEILRCLFLFFDHVFLFEMVES